MGKSPEDESYYPDRCNLSPAITVITDIFRLFDHYLSVTTTFWQYKILKYRYAIQ